MDGTSHTRVILLTAEGRSAVASLLVSGPAATAIVEAVFRAVNRRNLADQPFGKIVLGQWISGEDVVVCRRDERSIEVHSHGGSQAPAAIVASLVQAGCLAITWQDWLRQGTDGCAAEARIALAASSTERTAAILCDQMAGALARAWDAIAQSIDAGNVASASDQIDALLTWSALGAHLVEPWKVVLAGRPNVGKSSLVNALLGYERGIVHPTPGTTRDIVTTQTAIDGWPVELTDTAGLHDSQDALEAAGVAIARERLATADLVVWVFDATSTHPGELAEASAWPYALRVFNKCDLPAAPPIVRAAAADAILASAVTGRGLDALQQAISRLLVPVAPSRGQAIPFTPAQVDALRQARQYLAGNQLDEARQLAAAAGRC